MENYTIYKFTFSDGKVYIGQTNKPVEDRWKNGEGYKGQDVYVPITLDGWNNVKKEILHTNLTAEQANNLEKHYIKKFNSKNAGYNRTNGGGAKISLETNNDCLEELTNNLIQLCPALVAPAPNKLLTLQELNEIAKTEPSKQLVYETSYFGFSLISAKNANNYTEICYGGEMENYLWQFLVKWRVWESNPSVITTINTPWLEENQMEYTSFFIKNEKIKKYYLKTKTFPSVGERGFKNYESH